MKKLVRLTKINLLTFFDIHKLVNAKGFKEKKKVFPTFSLYIFAFGYLALIMFFASRFLLKGFIAFNIPHILLILVMVFASVYSTITTIFKVNKTVFDAKDYSFLLSLPIKKSTIITSKILLLYITNLFFSTMFIIPAYIAYSIKIETTILFHLLYIISFFLIPIIPTVIGAIIGSLFTSIISRFKYKNLLNILISLGFVFIMYYFSYKTQTMTATELANISVTIVNKFNSIYPFTKIYLNIIQNNSILNLLIFIITSFGLFKIFNYVLVKYFDSINSKITSVTIINKYDDKEVKVSSRLFSLYKKEIKKYFSSALYVLNTAIGCIMLLISLCALAIFGSDTLDALLDIPNVTSYFVLYGPLVFALFCSLSCTTNSSISLEGKNLWILKTLPIKIEEIFIAKIMVNLTILIPTIVIGGICLALIVNLSFIDFILLLIVPTIYAFFISGFGLLINLIFPDFSWTNEVKVIKQSIAVLISIAVGMLITMTPIFIKLKINQTLYSLIIGLIMLMLTIILYKILFNKGKKIFKSL